jgi:hypothetical protein
MKIATCYNVSATAECNAVVLRMAKKFLESQENSEILLVVKQTNEANKFSVSFFFFIFYRLW